MLEQSSLQRQTAVIAYFSSKLLLLFVFEMQDSDLPSSTVIQKQTAITAYFSSKQLLLLVFELQDSLLPSSTGILTVIQRQTAVTAYLNLCPADHAPGIPVNELLVEHVRNEMNRALGHLCAHIG